MSARELVVAGAAVLAACSGGEDSTSVVIGPEGGTIASEDGRFTLEVPPGALAEPATISVTRASGGAFPDAVGDLAYELAPDGLVFAIPARASLRLADDEAGVIDGRVPVLTLISRSADGTEAPLAPIGEGADAEPIMSRRAGELVIAGGLEHFSEVFAFAVEGGRIAVELDPGAETIVALVGDRWTETGAVYNGTALTLDASLSATECVPELLLEHAEATSDPCTSVETAEQMVAAQQFRTLQPPVGFRCTAVTTGVRHTTRLLLDGIPMVSFGYYLSVDAQVTCLAALPGEQPQCDVNHPETAPLTEVERLLDAIDLLCAQLAITQAVTTAHSSAMVPMKPPAEDETTIRARLAAYLEALPGGVLAPGAHAAVGDILDDVYPCGDGPNGFALCPPGAPAAVPGDYIIAATVTRATIPRSDPLQRYQYGFVFDSDGNTANNYQASAQFPNDFFDDTDQWYVAEHGPGTGWVLRVTDATGGTPTDVTTASRARIILVDNVLVLLVPAGELEVPDPSYRVTAFRHTGDFGLNPPHDWDGYVEPPVADGLARFDLY